MAPLTKFILKFVEYHKNLAMETTGNCDTVIFELNESCWGKFYEGLKFIIKSCGYVFSIKWGSLEKFIQEMWCQVVIFRILALPGAADIQAPDLVSN